MKTIPNRVKSEPGHVAPQRRAETPSTSTLKPSHKEIITMELQEHLDESPELREWYEVMTVEMDRLTAAGFPNVVPGVMDADAGITHSAYLEEIEELVTRRIWNTDDDKDVNLGEIQSFDEWKRERRENVTEHIEFSYCTCDLCGTRLGGGRHYITALPEDTRTNDNYVSYTVCDNCYLYVCNGDLPEF